jgi:hypothetical protein
MSLPPPFLILGLPRSRTAWLSRFLGYAPWSCGHEEARYLRAPADVRAWLRQPYTGSAETALARWWPLIHRFAPDARIVVVRRPIAEVVDSLDRLGLGFDRSRLRAFVERDARALDRAERHLAPLSVTFANLESEAVCAQVFNHCLGLSHDHAWWMRWAPVRVECDMRAILRYAQAFQRQMNVCARAMLAELRHRHDRPRPLSTGTDGIDLFEESLARLMADGDRVFAEHCIAVGEMSDEYRNKNLPLIEALAAAGRVHIVTARCNGRLLAYLCSVIAESLEHVGVVTATQTLFFASQDAPGGLGLRLQRASIGDLRQRGVGEVYMRAGVRGAGPRLGVLYRRLGAQEHGTYFKLTLDKAA